MNRKTFIQRMAAAVAALPFLRFHKQETTKEWKGFIKGTLYGRTDVQSTIVHQMQDRWQLVCKGEKGHMCLPPFDYRSPFHCGPVTSDTALKADIASRAKEFFHFLNS